MDWVAAGKSTWDRLGKWKVLAPALILGILLMAVPAKEMPQPAGPEEPAVQTLQEELETILSTIAGAGKVRVLLTEKIGEQRVYQVNEDQTVKEGSQDLRRDTVLISNSQRQEEGLLRQICAPVYQGAVVVCRGGDDPAVRLAVVEAVKSVTGLSAHRITVLKMK